MSKKLRNSLLAYMAKYPKYAPKNGKRLVHSHIENMANLYNKKLGDFFEDYVQKGLCTPEEEDKVFRVNLKGVILYLADYPKQVKKIFSELDDLMLKKEFLKLAKSVLMKHT